MTKFTQSTAGSTTAESSPCGRFAQWLSACLPCMRPGDNSLFDYQKLDGKEQITQLNHDGKGSAHHVEL